MNDEKALIKNAATERMFLKVAPEHMVQKYFDLAENNQDKDKTVRNKARAISTMYAAKHSEAAFNKLFEFYLQTTGQPFELYADDSNE